MVRERPRRDVSVDASLGVYTLPPGCRENQVEGLRDTGMLYSYTGVQTAFVQQFIAEYQYQQSGQSSAPEASSACLLLLPYVQNFENIEKFITRPQTMCDTPAVRQKRRDATMCDTPAVQQ